MNPLYLEQRVELATLEGAISPLDVPAGNERNGKAEKSIHFQPV